MDRLEKQTPESLHLSPYPNFVLVPQTDENTYYKQFVGQDLSKTRATLERDIQVINDLDPKKIPSKDRTQFRRIRQFLNNIWEVNKDRLADFGKSSDAINDVAPYLESREVEQFPKEFSFYPIKIDKLELFLEEYLDQSKGQTIVLSETHASTVPLIRVLKEANPDSKISVIVFDTHIDTDLGPDTDVPRKSNILRLLVDKDKNGRRPPVETVIVIGVPNEINATQKKSATSPDNYGKKIKIITEEELNMLEPNNEPISNDELTEILRMEMERFKQDGTTNVLISFDIDVLQSRELGLTAMEYNSLHALLYLASLNLESYADNPKMIFSLLTNTGFAGEISGSILDSPIILGGNGLSLPLVSRSLEIIKKLCKELGLDYGIKYKDSKVLGDIVELSGPDYQDLTKKSVLEVSQAMVTQ